MLLRVLLKIFLLAAILFLLSISVQSQKPGRKPQKPKQKIEQPAKKTEPPEIKTEQPVKETPKKEIPAKNDKQWALIVGVSDYPGGIQDLVYPRADAEAVKDLLLSSAAFREDHIRTLIDKGNPESLATKSNIFAAVDDYLAQGVKPGDEVIIFLAGHGIARGLGAEARSYFLPVDVDVQSKESLERTGVNLEELAAKLGSLKAAQFTVFIDACREDPFPGRGVKGNMMTDVMARGLRISPPDSSRSEPPSSVVFYSCSLGERAYEDEELKHGVFTYYILQGIRELAGRPDGRVEAGMLAVYLRENVHKWTEEFARRAKFSVEQTPSMAASEVRGSVVIVRITPIAQNLPSPPAAGEIYIVAVPEGAAVTIDGLPAGRGAVHKELAPKQYAVRAEQQGFLPYETKIDVIAGYRQDLSITLKPVSSSQSYEKGVQFESRMLWPQAVAAYEQAVREDPNSIPAYERLASVYLKSGRYRDAADLLTTAAQKFSDSGELHALRSRALSAWAQIDEKQDPSSNARPNKAVKQKDARKESVKAAELAVQKAPDQASSHMALGYAYLADEKDRPKAVQPFVKASIVAPEEAEPYFGAGYAYRLTKQYRQAIPQLEHAVYLKPDYYEAQRELAYCHHALGENDQAIRSYETASSCRSGTDNTGEMAGNNLALSALYTQKGNEMGGARGQAYKDAGKGYETDARGYDPTLKIALNVLSRAGLSSRVKTYLPSDLRRALDSLDLPGGIKIPIF